MDNNDVLYNNDFVVYFYDFFLDDVYEMNYEDLLNVNEHYYYWFLQMDEDEHLQEQF